MKEKKEVTGKTKETQILISPDPGSEITVQLCNKCTCSDKVEAKELKIPYLVKAAPGGPAGFGLGNQISKWNEMNDKRSKEMLCFLISFNTLFYLGFFGLVLPF